MKKMLQVFFAVALVCMFSATAVMVTPASANLILNGGFETPDIGGRFTTYTSAPTGFDWSITGSGGYGVDIINYEWDGVSGTSNPDGYDQSVDIDYASTLSQSFSTTPGTAYRIRFAYTHNFNTSESTGYVDIAGLENLLSVTLVHDTPNTQQNMQWMYFEDTFTADSATTELTFTGEYSNGKLGFSVDDVSVIPVGGTSCAGSAEASTYQPSPVYGSSDLAKHLSFFLLPLGAVIGLMIWRRKR